MSRKDRPILTRQKLRPRVILTRPKKPNKSNSNSNTNDPISNIIYIKDISTETPVGSNFWVINKDVTIESDKRFVISNNETVITNYTFTNNGDFVNAGTFCSFDNFTNNGKFDNGGAFNLNFGNLLISGDTKRVTNRGGTILSFGTYKGGLIIGNQVQIVKNPVP